MSRYETFVIRHWRLDRGVERVEVTHVPTGNRVLLLSLAQALEWMAEQGTPPPEALRTAGLSAVDCGGES